MRNYHRNFIHLNSTGKAKDEANDKILLEDEGFGNCYTFIKEVILALAKNKQLCMILIRKHQNEKKHESLLGIIKIIVGSMYENIVNDEIFEKDVIFLLGDVIKLIVESEEHFYADKFDSDTFPYLILTEFIKES